MFEKFQLSGSKPERFKTNTFKTNQTDVTSAKAFRLEHSTQIQQVKRIESIATSWKRTGRRRSDTLNRVGVETVGRDESGRKWPEEATSTMRFLTQAAEDSIKKQQSELTMLDQFPGQHLPGTTGRTQIKKEQKT